MGGKISRGTPPSALRLQRFENHFQHGVDVGRHPVVREAQHPITLLIQEAVPASIAGRILDVLRAVQLDDELRLKAGEVGDVGANRVLAAEAEAVELASAKVSPEKRLNLGLSAPQFTAASNLLPASPSHAGRVAGERPPSAFGISPHLTAGGEKNRTPLPPRQRGEMSRRDRGGHAQGMPPSAGACPRVGGGHLPPPSGGGRAERGPTPPNPPHCPNVTTVSP